MKTELTPEESAKLIELGVDPKLASKCLLYFCDVYDEPLASWDRYEDNGKVFCATEDFYGRSVESRIVSMDADFDQSAKEENPIFDLSDILTIPPEEIYNIPLFMEWDNEYNKWCVGYNVLHLEEAPELIDSLYQLLIWVIENGYYKPETEEK